MQTAGGPLNETPAGQSDIYLELLLAGFQYRTRLLARLETVSQELDLVPAEMMTLLHLSLAPSSVSAIAQATAIRRNGASVLAQRLSARGLVERRRRRTDRRVVDVILTDKGQALLEHSLLPDLREQIRILFSPLSAQEQKLFLSFMRRLAAL